MLKHTRRRALGLLFAACASTHLMGRVPRAFGQGQNGTDQDMTGLDGENEKPDCLETKDIGPWTAQATDISASATPRNVPAIDRDTCDLVLEFQVNADLDSRIFVEGNPDGTKLPEDVLVKPGNRLLAKAASGEVAVDEALCGNCTDFYKDTVSIVLPLATAPLLRDEDSVEITLRLASKDCGFTIDCVTMREALDWATRQRDALAKKRDSNACTSAEDCFITTACCDVLGLSDDCFELRTLRRYRDEVLANRPGGSFAIAHYYKIAPDLLRQLKQGRKNPDITLLIVYARFVLPAAVSAWLGLNGLAYRLYIRMLNVLAGRDVPRAP